MHAGGDLEFHVRGVVELPRMRSDAQLPGAFVGSPVARPRLAAEQVFDPAAGDPSAVGLLPGLTGTWRGPRGHVVEERRGVERWRRVGRSAGVATAARR